MGERGNDLSLSVVAELLNCSDDIMRISSIDGADVHSMTIHTNAGVEDAEVCIRICSTECTNSTITIDTVPSTSQQRMFHDHEDYIILSSSSRVSPPLFGTTNLAVLVATTQQLTCVHDKNPIAYFLLR